MLMTITHHLHTGRVFSYGFYWRLKCQILIVERTGHARQGKSYSPFFFSIYIIVLKPGPAGRPGTRLTRGWNQAKLKKKPSVIRSKTWLQAIDFCFFTKKTSFWFLKKTIDLEDSVNRSKPGTRALDQTRSKNYDIYITMIAMRIIWSSKQKINSFYSTMV